MKKLLLVLALALPLVACNTIEGFGKDVGKVGSSIEKTAEKARH
jgi:predicted small secreted protein